MNPRVLNLDVDVHANTRECEPEVKLFALPDDHFVALDVNTLCVVELSKAGYHHIQKAGGLPAVLCHACTAGGLMWSRRAPVFEHNPDTTCRALVLHLSDQCNLSCSYCYVRRTQAGVAQPPSAVASVMSFDIASAALRMFPADVPIRLAFFGGEPLMQLDLMMKIADETIDLSARRGLGYGLHVTTNGTLIGSMAAHVLATRGFSAIVSCDGPQDLHDRARGTGSHAKVIAGLQKLSLFGVSHRVTLRGTWGVEPRLVERLAFLNELARQGLAAGVALEPATPFVYSSDLDAQLHAATAWYVKQIAIGRRPMWKYLDDIIRRLLWSERRGTECGAGKGYYVVGPDGALYACHRHMGAQIGRVHASTPAGSLPTVDVDEAARGQWLDNRFCARSECSRCWARHLCGGACRSESLESCGRIIEPHAGRCMLMRRLIGGALWVITQLPREKLQELFPRRWGRLQPGKPTTENEVDGTVEQCLPQRNLPGAVVHGRPPSVGQHCTSKDREEGGRRDRTDCPRSEAGSSRDGHFSPASETKGLSDGRDEMSNDAAAQDGQQPRDVDRRQESQRPEDHRAHA